MQCSGQFNAYGSYANICVQLLKFLCPLCGRSFAGKYLWDAISGKKSTLVTMQCMRVTVAIAVVYGMRVTVAITVVYGMRVTVAIAVAINAYGSYAHKCVQLLKFLYPLYVSSFARKYL